MQNSNSPFSADLPVIIQIFLRPRTEYMGTLASDTKPNQTKPNFSFGLYSVKGKLVIEPVCGIFVLIHSTNMLASYELKLNFI